MAVRRAPAGATPHHGSHTDCVAGIGNFASGSGSTLIAAENTGRVCCGVELDPLYVDVIIRRYEVPTSTPAILADTGEPFATVAARRRNDEDDGSR